MAKGYSLKRLAQRLHVSAPRITQIRDRIGCELRRHMGAGILAEVMEEPSWRKSLRCSKEKDAERLPPAGAK